MDIFEATYKGMQERKSKHGGVFYYLFFEKDGIKYKTMAYEKLRNFYRWKKIINATRGCTIGGLRCVKGTLIDGNCNPEIIKEVNVNQFKMDFE